MIAELRAYFDLHIKLVDPDLDPIEDALDDEPINQVEADRGYKLVIGDNSPARSGNSYRDSLDITLILYTKAVRDELASFDALYDKGLNIKDRIIAPINAKNDPAWTDIFSLGMVPGAEATDDKTFNLILNFNIRRDSFYNNQG